MESSSGPTKALTAQVIDAMRKLYRIQPGKAGGSCYSPSHVQAALLLSQWGQSEAAKVVLQWVVAILTEPKKPQQQAGKEIGEGWTDPQVWEVGRMGMMMMMMSYHSSPYTILLCTARFDRLRTSPVVPVI